MDGEPDFERNTLAARGGGVPDRAGLFELFRNDEFCTRLAGWVQKPVDETEHLRLVVEAMTDAGCGYATTHASAFPFARRSRDRRKTISRNDAPADFDCGRLERALEF